MRVLVDHATGELVEVIEEAVLDLTPYSYREAKAAHMRASMERRDAVKTYADAAKEKGAAERAYRSLKAQAVLAMKSEHGSTVASDLANGREDVAEAKERAIVAEGMVYAALEQLRLCTEDRQGITQLVAWSRAVAMRDGEDFQ